MARRVQGAHLTEVADHVQAAATAVLGLVVGIIAARALGTPPLGWMVAAVCAVALAAGARVGPRVWRPMAAGLIVTTLVITLVGALG